MVTFKTRLSKSSKTNGNVILANDYDSSVKNLETKTKEIIISHEHLDYTWMDYNTSMEKTTFDNAKTVLTRAQTLLAKTL